MTTSARLAAGPATGRRDIQGKSRLLPQSARGWLVLAALAVVVAALPIGLYGWLDSRSAEYYTGLTTLAMIWALLALAMYLLVGATGLVTLGHGAFFGLAAYTVYLISPENAAKPIWMTLPACMAVGGLAAAVVGLFALRTSGFFFLMTTLAFGQMIYFVFHDTGLGGSTDGVYFGKPLISAFGATLELPRRQRVLGPYYVALAQLVLTYLGLAALLSTLFGRALEGIRVNEHRMRAIGFDTQQLKWIAFTLAGALAGGAGHMWALHRGTVNPELVGWNVSADALLMIVLGGLGSLHGPILGAFALTGLEEISQLVTERKLIAEGLVILAVVLLLPRGLAGLGSAFGRRRPPGGGGGGHG